MLCAFVLITIPANASEWSDFDFLKLKKVVQDKGINKIDDFLSTLPANMLTNPILVYNSHALKADLVTFQTPRIILFNRDASLILSISRNPGASAIANGKDTLEIINFNKLNGKFEFMDIPFDGKTPPFSQNIELNPQSCLACHGQNPRPIFQDYNAWPGFYGSFSQTGASVAGSPEALGFKNFMETKGSQPRYKNLNLVGVDTFDGNFQFSSVGYSKFFDDNKFSTNMFFGVLVESLMHKRMAKKLKSVDSINEIFPLFYYLGEPLGPCYNPRNERNNVIFNAGKFQDSCRV